MRGMLTSILTEQAFMFIILTEIIDFHLLGHKDDRTQNAAVSEAFSENQTWFSFMIRGLDITKMVI